MSLYGKGPRTSHLTLVRHRGPETINMTPSYMYDTYSLRDVLARCGMEIDDNLTGTIVARMLYERTTNFGTRSCKEERLGGNCYLEAKRDSLSY